MPTEPLVHVMLFWALFGVGALLGAFAMAAVVAMATNGMETISATALAVAAPGCAACFFGAVWYWRKLRK